MKLNTHKIGNAIRCVCGLSNSLHMWCILGIIILNVANLYHRNIANTMEVIRDAMLENITCLFITTSPLSSLSPSFVWFSIEHIQSQLLTVVFSHGIGYFSIKLIFRSIRFI